MSNQERRPCVESVLMLIADKIEKQAQQMAREQRKMAAENQKKRKNETRAKVLIGVAILNQRSKSSTFTASFMTALSTLTPDDKKYVMDYLEAKGFKLTSFTSFS